MRACFRAPLCCHSSKIRSQKRAYSILSSAGSTHHNENGVTRDSGAELGVGQLTGRGNRRPEVIRDVIKQKEEVHLQRERGGCPHTVLVGQLTKAGQEKSCVRGTSWKSLTKDFFLSTAKMIYKHLPWWFLDLFLISCPSHNAVCGLP